MHDFKHKKNGYFKFLFSYLIAFLLPLLVLSTYFYPKVREDMKENALAAGNHSLALLKNSTDNQFRMISNYPSAVLNNPDITFRMLHNGSAFDKHLLQMELKKMVGTNHTLEKVLLYNKTEGIFYGIDALYAESEINEPEGTFYYYNWDKESFMAYYLNLRQVDVRAAEPVCLNQTVMKDVITISLPIPVGNPKAELVLIVLVREEAVFADITNEEGNFFAVLDGNNKPIAFSRYSEMPTKEDICEMASECDKNGRSIMENDTHIISILDSDFYDMKYAIILDKIRIGSDMSQTGRNTVILLVFLMAGGAVLIWGLAHISYKPLLIMRKNTQKNEEQLKSYFLTQCLEGGFPDEAQIRLNAQACQVRLLAQNCCIIFMTGNAVHIRTLVTEFLDAAFCKSEWAENGFAWYHSHGTNPETEILLLSYEKEEQLEKWTKHLREAWQQRQPMLYIGIGRSGPMADIHMSYMLAMAAVKYAVSKGKPSIVGYNGIEIRRTENLDEIFESSRRMEIAILRKNKEDMIKTAEQLAKYLQKLRGAEETYRVVYRNVYNLLAGELTKRGEKYEYVIAMSDKTKMEYEKMEEDFISMARLLEKHMKKEEPEGETPDIQKVFAYMEENYADYNLSLQTLAEQFGMTYSNMSHYFKNNTGMNFSVWLEKLRVQKAREYLERTDESLEKIAVRVGYATANSFGRAFKKHCGITPGEYRRKSKKET
ncbi:MAG TPA: hypothetical protein DCR27_11420 [Lachnospiraceae bacterium]|nr:hypothetical protein [Lachnospiraceae bacterium]